MHFSREYIYISHHFLCISLCQKSKFPSTFPRISLPDYPFFPTMVRVRVRVRVRVKDRVRVRIKIWVRVRIRVSVRVRGLF